MAPQGACGGADRRGGGNRRQVTGARRARDAVVRSPCAAAEAGGATS